MVEQTFVDDSNRTAHQINYWLAEDPARVVDVKMKTPRQAGDDWQRR